MNDLLNNTSGHSLILMTQESFQKVLDEIYTRAKQSATIELDAQSQQVDEPLVSKQDVMQIMGKSATTLWKWARRGYLKPVKVGGRVMYKQADINRILKY